MSDIPINEVTVDRDNTKGEVRIRAYQMVGEDAGAAWTFNPDGDALLLMLVTDDEHHIDAKLLRALSPSRAFRSATELMTETQRDMAFPGWREVEKLRSILFDQQGRPRVRR